MAHSKGLQDEQKREGFSLSGAPPSLTGSS